MSTAMTMGYMLNADNVQKPCKEGPRLCKLLKQMASLLAYFLEVSISQQCKSTRSLQ